MQNAIEILFRVHGGEVAPVVLRFLSEKAVLPFVEAVGISTACWGCALEAHPNSREGTVKEPRPPYFHQFGNERVSGIISEASQSALTAALRR